MEIKETRKEYSGLTNISISDLSIIDYELTGVLEKKVLIILQSYLKRMVKAHWNVVETQNKEEI